MEATLNNAPANKVTLYRFEREPGRFCFVCSVQSVVPCMTLTFAYKQSPYVNKLDALLTFSALKNVTYEGGTILEAPRGKLPYISLDGTFIPDSELAYDSCISKGLVHCLDRKATLNEKELALSRSIQALVERNLIEMMTYERQVYLRVFNDLFSILPQLDRKLVSHKGQTAY